MNLHATFLGNTGRFKPKEEKMAMPVPIFSFAVCRLSAPNN